MVFSVEIVAMDNPDFRFAGSAGGTPNAAYFLLLAAYFTVCWERRRPAGRAIEPSRACLWNRSFPHPQYYLSFPLEIPPLAALPANREIIFGLDEYARPPDH